MVYCTGCGNPLKEGAKFCPSCGAKVEVAKTEVPHEESVVKKEKINDGEKDGNYTKEGRKIIDSGPRPQQNYIPPKKKKVKKKGGCLRFFLKSILILFILMIVGVVIIWNLPDDAFENSDSNTNADQINTEATNTAKSKERESEIRIDPNDKNIADKYSYGVGVKPDQYEALKMYEKAAKKGDLNALVQLSDYYMQGIWVKKDSKKAMELLKKAAEAGSLEAKWQLEFLESQK
jgi:hypothetical protein